jgi:uncharacterized protein (DUF433 family)
MSTRSTLSPLGKPTPFMFVTISEACAVTGLTRKQVDHILVRELGAMHVATKRQGQLVLSELGLCLLEVANAYRESLTSPIRKVIYKLFAQDPAKDTVEHKDDVCSLTVRVDMCKRRVQEGLKALANAKELISADPEIMRGEPCIRGTRIPVYALAAIAEAKGPEVALRTYPQCGLHHVEAARRYALAYPPRGRPRNKAPKAKGRQVSKKVVRKKVKSLAA